MSNKLSSDLPKSIDWAQVRKEVGNHCKRRHDYKKANKNFQRSLKTNSKKLDSVYLVANSFAREANLDQALKLLDEKSKLGKLFKREAVEIIKLYRFRMFQGSFQVQSSEMRLQLRKEFVWKKSAPCEWQNSSVQRCPRCDSKDNAFSVWTSKGQSQERTKSVAASSTFRDG